MEITEKDIDSIKLIKEFGAEPINRIKNLPDFYSFNSGIIVSHRDFDKFLESIKKGEKCAIVSGVNASGTLHLGHKPIFDTNLYFQKKFNIPVFIPISDDESYVAGKIKNQKEGLEYALKLAKQMIAYGFDPKKTYFIIDQIYTNIYNLAIKLSVKMNLSQAKAVYGYKNEDNLGLYFYPCIQSAHILFPQEEFKIKNVLVPIGPDEDPHLRICRDIASKMNYNKPAVIHSKFLPGIDGEKMSKSRNNAIYLEDSEKEIRKKIGKAFSGGQKTIEEHKKLGGNPDVDVSFIYLKHMFLNKKESEQIEKEYKSGKLLTSDLKKMFAEEVISFTKTFQENLKKVDKELDKCILKNST